MLLSFPPDDEQSNSTLSRESMVHESFVLTFTMKDMLQQLLLIYLLHLTILIDEFIMYKLLYHTQGRSYANEHLGFSDRDDTKLDQMDIPAHA